MTKALHVAFQIFQNAGAALFFLHIQHPLIRDLLLLVPLYLAALQPHLIAAQLVLQTFDLLAAGSIRLFTFGQLLPGAGDLLFAGGFAGFQLAEPLFDLFQRGLRGDLCHPHIRNLQRNGARLAGQRFHLPRPLVAVAGQRRDLLGQLQLAMLFFRHRTRQLVYLGGARRDLLPQLLVAGFRLGDFALYAGDVLLIVRLVVAQHCRLRFQRGGLFFLLVLAAAHGIHLDRPLLRQAAGFLHMRFRFADGLARLFILGARQFQLGAERPQRVAAGLQRMQPQPDLQFLFFARQFQKFLGFFRLLFQRTDAVFQLLHNVAQPQQVIFGGGEPPLRFVFAVAVFSDARRFFKNFAPFGGFGRHNVADTPLTDDGIAIPPKTGIHKQHLHILQPHRRLIDDVFAFARAIIPAGHLDIVGIEIQLAGGVVKHQ